MENINFRDEVYRDIHNLNPTWWMRSGIGVVFIIFALLFLLSYFIKYPDTVTADVRLISNTPAVTIPAKSSGRITDIKIPDGGRVDADSYLVVLQNTSNENDIRILKNELREIAVSQNYLGFFEAQKDHPYKLGDVQVSWENFLKVLFEYYQIVKLSKYDESIARLTKELSILQQEDAHLQKIIMLDKDVKKLIGHNQEVDSALYKAEVMSTIEYNNKFKNYLDIKKSSEQELLTFSRNKLEIVRINNSIENLQQAKRNDLIGLNLKIKENLTQLQLAITSWEENYVIKSPIKGTLNYLQPLKLGHYVNTNELLVVVTPKLTEYNAVLRIPFFGAGKVQVGQKVNIKLDDYPYYEYGFLTGKMSKISKVASQDHYLGDVTLDNRNKTSYNKVVTINENSKGTAEIITKDRSFLGRIFDKILYVFNR